MEWVWQYGTFWGRESEVAWRTMAGQLSVLAAGAREDGASDHEREREKICWWWRLAGAGAGVAQLPQRDAVSLQHRDVVRQLSEVHCLHRRRLCSERERERKGGGRKMRKDTIENPIILDRRSAAFHQSPGQRLSQGPKKIGLRPDVSAASGGRCRYIDI